MQPLGDRFQRLGIAQKHPQPLLGLGGGIIERFGLQNPGAHVVALQLGAELQQHRRARLQNLAELGKRFGKQHRLEMAGRVGQAQNAHLIAGLGAALLARHHGRGNLAGGGAGFHRLAEIRPALHPQPLERGGVVVERMAGQKEADRVIFAAQPLGRQPRLDLRQHDARRVGHATEHIALTKLLGLVVALAGGDDRLGTGEHRGAVAVDLVKSAGRRQTFDQALIDGTRIDLGGEVSERAELAALPPCHDLLDRVVADTLQSGERVEDGVVGDLEGRARTVDRWRLDLDPKPLRF